MAFSSSPVNDTYSTQRISLVNNLEAWPTSDSFSDPMSGMLNVIAVKSGNETPYGETRLPIRASAVAALSTGIVRGAYVWEKTTGTVYYFVVTTDGTTSKVYSSTNGTTWSAINTLGTNASTPVRFTEFIDDVNTKKLIMVDGIEGYVFTNNSAGTKITDTDFPSPHVPFPVFLDGYLFLAKAGTGDVYNSDLNDPTSWTAGSFLSSELYPDDIQALLKMSTYILAVGTQGSEFFYDAANATGSPLARYDGGSLPFGTSYPNTIATNKETVILLVNNNDGSLCFKIIEGFKYVDLPAHSVLKVISAQIVSSSITSSELRGMFLRQNGQLLYLLNLDGTTNGLSGSDTLVYAIDSQMWSKYTYNNATSPYPVYFTCGATSESGSTFLAGHYNGTVFFGSNHSSSGNATDCLDGSTEVDIQEKLYVAPQTFGTFNRKFMYRLGVGYVSLDPSVSDAPYVAYSDNMSAVGSERQLAGVSSGTGVTDGGFPFITQLGSFRQRRFIISAASGVSHWWNFIECDINKGQQ